MSWKTRKRLWPFSFVKAKTKERKKAFSCESAAEPASSGKGSFYNQDEWLWEIQEHERKSDTSEKQSVEAGNELFAAHCSRFLVLGIFTNLAIIKNMFSFLPVKYLRSQSNDLAFTKLKE